MRIKVKHRFRHTCDLPPEETEFQVNSPYDSRWRRIKNYILQCATISRHAESYRYFRSRASLKKERRRHLHTPQNKYVIHPFSMLAQRKSTIMCFVWLMTYLVESYSISMISGDIRQIQVILTVANFVILIDACSRFLTGYVIKRTGIIVLDRKTIFKHYLTTFCFFDMVPALGFLIYLLIPESRLGLKVAFFQLHKLRLARAKTIIECAERILRKYHLHDAAQVITSILLTVIFILHTFTCLSSEVFTVETYVNDDLPSESWLTTYKMEYMREHLVDFEEARTSVYLYALHLSMVMCHLLGAGPVYRTTDEGELFLFACVLMTGLLFYVYCIAKILMVYGAVNISQSKFDEMIIQANNYLFKRDCPRDLKQRIFNYYDYKYDKSFFNEDIIMGSLSEHLRMEVLLYSRQNLLRTVRFFKVLPKAAVGSVLALMKQEIYLKNDVIYRVGAEEKDGIYLILYGTCMIHSEFEEEMMHIEDGDHFSEPPILAKKFGTVVYSVVALETTEVYRMDEDDLAYCCRNYPEILQTLELMILGKIERYQEMEDLKRDKHGTEDILYELGQRRILQPGLKRIDFA